jgi:fibronectin type 3 domain-containing protein
MRESSNHSISRQVNAKTINGAVAEESKHMSNIKQTLTFREIRWSVWLFLVVMTGLTQVKAQGDHWLTGYYANYNESVMSPAQVDYTKLTHIIYWPLIPNKDGTLNTSPFGAPFPTDAIDLVTRAHQAGVKALLGVGGNQSSGASAGFTGSTTPANLSTFVNNIVNIMQQYDFDGVDINWEAIGSGAGDNTQFPAFIAALRAKLNTIAPRPLLTMPPETYPNGGRPDLIGPIYADFDQLNIQTYQMSFNFCGWETWFNSPLNNGGATFILVPSEALPSITGAIADYTTTHAQIPISRLAMGMQFDAEVWTGGSGTSTGGVTQPKQTWTNDSNCNSNSGAPSIGTMPYRTMSTTLATNPNYSSHFDTVADQSWLSYDPSGAGTTNESKDQFISYDGAQSIAKKGVDLSPAQAGVGGTMGGAFIFELSGDFLASQPAAQQHPLLTAAHSMQYLLPGQLTGLSATAGAAKVQLTWSAAAFADSYNVYTEPTSSMTPTGTPVNVKATSTSISSLTPGTLYYFLVEPVDAFGSGAPVQTSATQTGAIAPPAPTGLTAAAGVYSVSLQWNASPGATSYILERSIGTGWIWSKTLTTLSYTDTALTAGTTYYYAVMASNAYGTSVISNEAFATPYSSAPQVPTDLAAAPSPTQVKLTWNTAPNATAYTIARSTNGATFSVLGTSTTTSFTDATVTANATYYYEVQSTAGAAASAYCAPIKVIAATPTPAPTGVTATPGVNEIQVSWNAVTGATSYFLQRSTGSGWTWSKTLTSPSYLDTGLTAGTWYYYILTATGPAGTSAYSSEASAQPYAAAPAVPSGLAATTSPTQIQLTWGSVANITSYNIARSTDGVNFAQIANRTVPGYLDTAVTANSTYYYEVQSVEGVALSSYSTAIKAVAKTPGPDAPTKLATTTVSAVGSVILKWTAPAGATAAYSYEVFEGTAAGQEAATAVQTVANNVTTATLTGLASNKTYYFTVKTIYDGVLSVASNEVVSVPRVVWVPDYTGEAVRVRVGGGTTVTSIAFSLPSCNPNSLAVNHNKLYVICNSDFGNSDAILVYDATKIRSAAAGTLSITPTKTITSGDFDGLIGVAFDSSNDLWVASNGNSEILEFTAAELAGASPKDIVSLIDSPSSPVALAFDTDSSLWVTGLYGDGILLNFDSSQFGLQGAANPRYCASTDALGGICISQANLFLQPEGVAVFKGSVWVANNSTTGSNKLGGATPGRELVNLAVSNGTLAVKTVYGTVVPDAGGTATSPFFCPGGLFASSIRLWVNDESYGEANPQCGANGDTSSATGGVFSFTATQLTAKPVTQTPTFTKLTGRPGFGGIFVENDR